VAVYELLAVGEALRGQFDPGSAKRGNATPAEQATGMLEGGRDGGVAAESAVTA